MWTSLLLLALPAPSPALAPASPALAPDSLQPRSVSRAAMERSRFRPEWRLPDLRRDPCLIMEAKAMAKLEAPTRPKALPEYRDLSTLGDVAAFAAKRREQGVPGKDVLVELKEQRPDLLAFYPMLSELLDDSRLRSSKWNPEDDRKDDGIWIGPSWNVKKEGKRKPWSKLKGAPDVHQAMVLLWADLEAIKQVENDYSVYPNHVGARYDFIRPTAGSYVRSAKGAEEPFAALAIEFQNDLPWPFSNYRCDLEILNGIDTEGHLTTDIWSDSKDFYWMAGRDVFVPLETSEGEFAGLLMLRQFGFDLDGVPERATHRKAALRQGLGNLKLRAEAAFRTYGGEPRTLQGSIPSFPVKGGK